MIRLGICTGIGNIGIVSGAGFEYMETGFNELANMQEEDYQKALATVRAADIGVEAANGMLPGTLKVTGPEVDEAAVREYLERAFRRGHEIGIRVVVFGSGASRRVPDGFPQDEAWRQIARYLTIVSEYAEKYDIDLAIEPLRRAECNIMNLVTEGTLISAMLNLPRIGVLGDTHHMICSCEPYSALTQAGKLLKHMHISHSMGNEGGRDYPKPDDVADYEAVFKALKEAGYEGRVSIEAGTHDIAADAPLAFQVLDTARRANA